MIWRIFMVVTAFLLLSAHFLHAGNLPLAAASLLAPLLLLIKKRAARLAIECLLYGGAIIWLHTGYVLTQERLADQEPWARMVVILTAVAVFTAAAGGTLRSTTVKQRYKG